MFLVRRLAASLVAAASWSGGAAAADASEPVIVFAAASLTSALQEVLPPDRFGGISLSFASSASLARQIEAGAPADLFLSADSRWMEYLETHDLLAPGTREELLTNRLVVISRRGAGIVVEPRPDFDFAAAFAGRLAVGDPDHVPAGNYARQALQALGWWTGLADRLAPAVHARAALVLVERGECDAGIVYATDAAISRRVEVVAALPASLHAPIRYPVATVRGRDTPVVARLRRHLRSDEAAGVFTRHGFGRVGAVRPREADDAHP